MKHSPKHAVMKAVKSLSPRGRIAACAAAVALIGGGSAAAAVMASASETPGCNAVTYCGDQALDSLGLAMSVTNHPNVGAAVQVLNNDTTNGKEDFYQYNPPGTSGSPQNWKVFQYAPHGAPYTPASAPDGLCVTVSGSSVGSALVLEDCTYSYSQQFTATPSGVVSGYTWRERGQSWLITDPHDGGQYTHLVIANATTDYGAGQAFTYDG
jgi:hypothetical protein